MLIYALFKQGNVGDNNTDKPGMLDFKGKAKWEAWGKQKGKKSADAQQEYVQLAKTLLTKYKLEKLITFWTINAIKSIYDWIYWIIIYQIVFNIELH